MTYHQVYNKSNTTGATCGVGTAYPSGAPELIPGFSGVRVARSLVFSCILYHCLSVSFSFWPLYIISFFDLRLLITPLASSTFLIILLCLNMLGIPKQILFKERTYGLAMKHLLQYLNNVTSNQVPVQ